MPSWIRSTVTCCCTRSVISSISPRVRVLIVSVMMGWWAMGSEHSTKRGADRPREVDVRCRYEIQLVPELPSVEHAAVNEQAIHDEPQVRQAHREHRRQRQRFGCCAGVNSAKKWYSPATGRCTSSSVPNRSPT